MLKKYLPQAHQHILQKLITYFGPNHPGLVVTAPDQDSIETLGGVERSKQLDHKTNGRLHGHTFASSEESLSLSTPHLRVIFISARDGRDALVDLARTFAEMRQYNKLRPDQIVPEIIDMELTEGVFPEPDLLILFSPHICLDGYPPWQLRVTEIFRMQDNSSVGYRVFLHALQNFARAEMRSGR